MDRFVRVCAAALSAVAITSPLAFAQNRGGDADSPPASQQASPPKAQPETPPSQKGLSKLTQYLIPFPESLACLPGDYVVRFEKEPVHGTGHIPGQAFALGSSTVYVVDGDTDDTRTYVTGDDLPYPWVAGGFAIPCS